MTPLERDLLTNLFDRLRQSERGPRDPEAEQLIGAAIAQQPAVPYYLAQVVLVQDQALSAAQARIRELEAKATPAVAPPPAPARSFLGEASPAGPWGQHSGGRFPATPASATGPMAAPAPAPAPATSQPGGGFLRGALQTAAGVAGGALLFEGLNSLLHLGGSSWGAGHSFLPTAGAPTLIEETVINQFGDAPLPSPSGDAPLPEHALEQASWTGDQGDFTPADDDLPVDDADLPDQDDTDLA